MASSRIFIKGLPPKISEDEFKKHFGSKHAITDAKLIPHRRIGYIGYRTPDDAVDAVKYFNRSFIRMSKIGVEVARPISDASLPLSRKAQRERDREINKTRQKIQDDTAEGFLNGGIKRKRSDIDEADPKLREFMEVMQPASKTKPWHPQNDVTNQPPSKMQAIEVPEALSDEEYESVPKKVQTKRPLPASFAAVDQTPISPPAESPAQNIEVVIAPNAVDSTDDDWLRSRTNRLLDLMDPEETSLGQIASAKVNDGSAPATNIDEPEINEQDNHKLWDNASPFEEPNDKVDSNIEAIRSNGRLFVRNLPYTASETELREHFTPFGSLEEVHLPVDAQGASKGFLLVQFLDPEAAVEAFHNLDGEPFQGRLLHILPAALKRENKMDEFAIARLPLKKQRQIKKKTEASSTSFNWNSLYMNQDAVNSAIADRLGVSKSELLDPTSADAGVKQAIAETSVVQETKSYFVKNGVDLDAFKKRERGDTAILVKNFQYGTNIEELRKIFEEFGQIRRILMPPAKTIAIVEFAQATQARAAFSSLAYRRVKDSVLFLEKGPKDLFTNITINPTAVEPEPVSEKSTYPKPSVTDLLGRESAAETADTTTLFVRNLNFSTTSDRLTHIFKPLDGFLTARVNTKTDPKKPGQVLSMGFGFIEFKGKEQAQAAIEAMNNYDLDGHKLQIKASHKGLDAAEDRRREDRAKKTAGKRTKIIIKNLPFEASKKDVRALFGTYGQLRSLRVPKKFDHSARGFAFADFITAREAENALEALKDTHLLGRRLVLEFAMNDPVDAEEEIEKMQKKVGSQVNKVALQKLTGGGRKKFNIEGDDKDED